KSESVADAVKKRIMESSVAPVILEGITLQMNQFEKMAKDEKERIGGTILACGTKVWDKMNAGVEYQIRLFNVASQDPEQKQFAKQIISNGQAMATWFIENSSPVDVNDERWQVYTVLVVKDGIATAM